MSYFVFDLDETLAQIYTVYYFVASLQTYPNMSESLTNSLKKAYKIFVKKIVKEEIKNQEIKNEKIRNDDPGLDASTICY